MDIIKLKNELKRIGIFVFERDNKLIAFSPYNLKKVFTTRNRFVFDIDKNFKELIKKPQIPQPVLSNIKIVVSTGCNFRCEYCIVYKNRKSINMNSVEGINYLAESSENSQIFTELEKKED